MTITTDESLQILVKQFSEVITNACSISLKSIYEAGIQDGYSKMERVIEATGSPFLSSTRDDAYEKAALACEDLEHPTEDGNEIIRECAKRIRALKITEKENV